MEVYTSLDEVSYRRKPERKEIPAIRKRLAEGWMGIEVKELAERVGEHGHTIVPGHMQGGIKAENCTAMQLFVLDFDDGATFGQILKRCNQFSIPVTFAYHTFSSTEAKEKFRVVFVYDQVLDDPFVIKLILIMLHQIFPECDKSCKNLDRMFYGGKELIYLNEDARFALVQLLTPFYQSLDVGDNFKRNIRSFCKKQKILLVNDMPAIMEIGQLEKVEKIDGIGDSAIVHLIGESANPSFFIMESRKEEAEHQNFTCKEGVRNLGITGDVACQLLADFNNGLKLSHDAKFALCTNLMHIKGGQKHFLDMLEKYEGSEAYGKWKNDMRYMKGYHSRNCSGEFCPYYGKCEGGGNIVNTLAMDRRIRKLEEEEYSSEEEVRECLRQNLEDAFMSIRDGVYLIKAQTGIGKTYSYIRLIKEHPEAKFLVALPTNRLKEQVAGDLSGKLDEKIFMTESIHGNEYFPPEILDEISQAHQQGFHNATKKRVGEYYKSIKDDLSQNYRAEECKRILEGIKKIKEERVVVTTHAFMVNLPEEFLKQYTIIIDEDILMLQIFNRTVRVSEGCLQSLLELGNPEYARIAKEMLDAEEGIYKKITASPYAKVFSEEELAEVGLAPEDNVNDIVLAGSFVRKEGEVKYFCPQKLPKMKYIVLSATLNEEIYRRYFQENMEVWMYPEKKARYMGKVFQLTYHSLGRGDLEKNIEVLIEFIRRLTDKLPNKPDLITFKSQERRLQERLGRRTGGLHFGNTCGINSLKGHDIVIVGTPYKVDEAYKLVACYLGVNVNREVDRQPKPRRVRYKGYEFVITTYDELLLREVQLYSLESELEQCVGRARLLNHECTVYVLSAFPCEQAELHMKDYLKR